MLMLFYLIILAISPPEKVILGSYSFFYFEKKSEEVGMLVDRGPGMSEIVQTVLE